MDRLIHIAAGAMHQAHARQAIVAGNLANLATPGFRADINAARAAYVDAGDGAAAFMLDPVIGVDRSAAPIQHTGRNMDIALSGEAMLAVHNVAGEERYTRRGDLMQSPAGMLMTGDGHLVLSDAGQPIALPEQSRISSDGSIWRTDSDTETRIARIKLVDGRNGMTKGRDGLFLSDTPRAADPTATLMVGALEGSNANAAALLTQMIDTSRAYELNVRVIATARDLDESSAALMRLDS